SIFFSEFLLFLTALIWGLSFVAQRKGMEFVGPFIFNGIRFAIGSISLLPLLLLKSNKNSIKKLNTKKTGTSLLQGSLYLGIVLFCGASLQQIGIINTTAGNAGFITSLYVVFTPLLGLFFKHKPTKQVWAGVILATAGLYFLSVSGNFTISSGDILVLFSAIFFAAHVLLIAWLSPKFNVIKISIIQFSITSVLSLIIAFATEEIILENIKSAAIPILYGGIMAVGVAYTLQVFAQQNAKPSHAAIILSFEALFAAIGGWLILNEIFTLREVGGCVLMLFGIIVAQLKLKKYNK
ncbi:MAG: DMT family transporter, partial [Bacteroidales bacterium]|nr:DMT family transporter [Bacteroidales bacterium]